MEKYEVMKINCPVLNKAFGNHPNLEVLLKLKDNEPVNIICPEHSGRKICHQSKYDCIYSRGWDCLK